MADLNSELVLRAVNYHGKELNSLIRETHQLLFMNVDYHLFLQRPPEVRENKEKLLALNRFIAQNLQSLFRNVPPPLEERRIEGDEDLREKCPDMPPYETFCKIDPGDRLMHFFQVVTAGDVILARVVHLLPDGDTLLSMQCFDPSADKSRYVEDLGIKCTCSMFEMIPLGANKGDLVRMVVKEVRKYKQSLVVSVNRKFLPAAKLQRVQLGLVRDDDLPSVYTYTKKAVGGGRGAKYENMLENSSRFHRHESLEGLCQELGLESGPDSLVVGMGRSGGRKTCIDHLARGIDSYKRGNNKEAFDHLNTALIIEPGNVEALIARGVLFSNDGNLDVALVDFEKALQLNPDHPKAQKYMSETLLLLAKDLKNSNKASSLISSYDLILATHPNHEALLDAKWKLMKNLRIDNSILRGKSGTSSDNGSQRINDSVLVGSTGTVTVNKSTDHYDDGGAGTIPLMLPHMKGRKREVGDVKKDETCGVKFGEEKLANRSVVKVERNLAISSPLSSEISFSLSDSEDIKGTRRKLPKKRRKFEEERSSKRKTVSFSLSESGEEGSNRTKSKMCPSVKEERKSKEKFSFSLSESDENEPKTSPILPTNTKNGTIQYKTSRGVPFPLSLTSSVAQQMVERKSLDLDKYTDYRYKYDVKPESDSKLKVEKLISKRKSDVKLTDRRDSSLKSEPSSRHDENDGKSKSDAYLRYLRNKEKMKSGEMSENEVRIVKLNKELNNNKTGASTDFLPRSVAIKAIQKLESSIKRDAVRATASGRDLERAANNVDKINKKIEERHLLSGSWKRRNEEADISRDSSLKLSHVHHEGKIGASKTGTRSTTDKQNNLGQGFQFRSKLSSEKAEMFPEKQVSAYSATDVKYRRYQDFEERQPSSGSWKMSDEQEDSPKVSRAKPTHVDPGRKFENNLLKFKLNKNNKNKFKGGLQHSEVKVSETKSRSESLNLQTKLNSSRNESSQKLLPTKRTASSQIDKTPGLLNLPIPVPAAERRRNNLLIPVPATERHRNNLHDSATERRRNNLPVPARERHRNNLLVPATERHRNNLPIPVPATDRHRNNLSFPDPVIERHKKNRAIAMARDEKNLPIPVPAITDRRKPKKTLRGRKH